MFSQNYCHPPGTLCHAKSTWLGHIRSTSFINVQVAGAPKCKQIAVRASEWTNACSVTFNYKQEYPSRLFGGFNTTGDVRENTTENICREDKNTSHLHGTLKGYIHDRD